MGFIAYTGVDGLHWIASALPDTFCPDRWFVALGYDAARAIGAEPGIAFTTRDEAQARQWVDTLARLYTATPSF